MFTGLLLTVNFTISLGEHDVELGSLSTTLRSGRELAVSSV